MHSQGSNHNNSSWSPCSSSTSTTHRPPAHPKPPASNPKPPHQVAHAQQPAAAQYNTAYAYAYYNAYAAAAYGGQLRGVGANEYMGTINPGYW
ncbi:hypothetical protein EYR36_008508 [Pleurotus pulmonarius]|nr:hypothetical protein EYR36_008508 [Pleurotus pulmonarius]